MHNFHSLDTSVLLDMLSDHTSKYTKMLAERSSDSSAYEDCKLMIAHIQGELNRRSTYNHNSHHGNSASASAGM